MVDILTKKKTRARAFKPREKETLCWCCESAPQTKTVRTRLRKYWRAQISAASGGRMRFVQTFQRHHSPFSSMTALHCQYFIKVFACGWCQASTQMLKDSVYIFMSFICFYSFITCFSFKQISKNNG